jgi:hypothetical protein
MAAFTTRPEIRGTFGIVASTHWLASAVGMSMLEKGGNAFDAAAAAGFTLSGGRAASERPARRSANPGVERSQSPLRDDLRAGCRARRRDDRPFPRARARPDPRHRAARRPGPRRVRRLDAAAARLGDAPAQRSPRAGDRLRRERLPGGRPHQRNDRPDGRDVPSRMAEFGRGLFAARQAAGARTAVSQPGARRHLSPGPRRSGRRESRRPDRARPRRLVSRLCRRGDRPVLPPRKGARLLGQAAWRGVDRRGPCALGGPGRGPGRLRLP